MMRRLTTRKRLLSDLHSRPAAEAEGTTRKASRTSLSSSPALLKAGGLSFPIGPELLKTDSRVQPSKDDWSSLAPAATIPAYQQPAKPFYGSYGFAARALADAEAAKDRSSADGTTPSLPTRRLRPCAPGPSRPGLARGTHQAPKSHQITASRQAMPGDLRFKPGHHLVSAAAQAILSAFQEPEVMPFCKRLIKSS